MPSEIFLFLLHRLRRDKMAVLIDHLVNATLSRCKEGIIHVYLAVILSGRTGNSDLFNSFFIVVLKILDGLLARALLVVPVAVAPQCCNHLVFLPGEPIDDETL